MLGDHQRVVGIVDRSKLDCRVIVNIIISLLLAHAEGGDRLSPMDGLSGIVDHPFFHQPHDPVGQEFRMDAQMFLIIEIG